MKLRAEAGKDRHGAASALDRRCRLLAAIAGFSQSAIAVRDHDALFAQAQGLARSLLDLELDLPPLLAGTPIDAVVDRALADDETEFVAAIVNVLRRARLQREHELSLIADVEGRFSRIFQHCPVALAMTTIGDDRIVDANERWLSMFGYRREEVLGRTNDELGISVDFAQRDQFVKQARASGVLRDAEMQLRTQAGATLDVIVSAVPLDSVPAATVWVSACVDITELKQAAFERDQLLIREQSARHEAEQAIEKLRAVYAITDSIVAHGPTGELLGEVLRRLRTTLQIDHASVLLVDEPGQHLYLSAIEGPDVSQPIPVFRVPMGAGVSGRVAVEGRPLIVNDYGTVDASSIETDDADMLRGIGSVMAAPFRIGDRVAGVVVVSTREPRAFGEEDLRLLVLASDRVGPAIERGRLIERIRTGIDRQRSLSRRLLTAQEEERRRIAVELHDELGQILTAVKIHLESVARSTPRGTGAANLATAIESVDDALQRVKDIALDLRPSVLDDLGLEAALRWYADRFAQGAGVAAHLSIDALPRLEPNLQTACFRVSQEALTNVERHARASHVWLDLHVLDGALELSVRDNGIGFDIAAARARAISGSSVGILGMQERVTLMGGEYDIIRVPAGGTEVRARFPLGAGAAA